MVYQARDTVLGRLVALKVMTSDLVGQPEVHVRFLREARSVAALQHPNIVVVHDLGEHNGIPFIAMEFLDGDPLDCLIRNRVPLTLPDKVDIVLQVAKALQYAHGRGAIHRDIKPGNIVRLRDGTVKVVDFGIAHLADQTITKTGMVLGTLAYLAPEQLRGEAIDRRTDIFSLGVVLYQLLSGKLPFEGTNTAEVMMKILLESPPSLAKVGNVTPPELEPIVDKALAKRKEDRYQSCAELIEALELWRKHHQRPTKSPETSASFEAGVSKSRAATQVHAIPSVETKPAIPAPTVVLPSGQRTHWKPWAIIVFIALAGFLGMLTLLQHNKSVESAAREKAKAPPPNGLSSSDISGSVTNGTTGMPSVGDHVALVSVADAPREIATGTTDTHGSFSFPVSTADHTQSILRVTHQAVNYFKPGETLPGSDNQITVYDATKELSGISQAVEVDRYQSVGKTLQVITLFALKNESKPPRTLARTSTFEFILPPNAKLKQTEAKNPGGRPFASAVTPTGIDRYSFNTPLRPGETQFQVEYQIPYSGDASFSPKPLNKIDHFVVMIPKGMTFRAKNPGQYMSMPDDQATVMVVPNAAAGQALPFRITGTGSFKK